MPRHGNAASCCCRRRHRPIALLLWLLLLPLLPPPLSLVLRLLAAAAAAGGTQAALMPTRDPPTAGLVPHVLLQEDDLFAGTSTNSSVAAIGRHLRGLRSLRLRTTHHADENSLVELSGAVLSGALWV